MIQHRQLQGKADPEVVKAIRELYNMTNNLQKVIDLLNTSPTPTSTTATPPPSLPQQGLNLNLVSPVQISSGVGSPEGVVVGNVGDQYHRQDGGAGTTFYVKESGAGTRTGWIGK